MGPVNSFPVAFAKPLSVCAVEKARGRIVEVYGLGTRYLSWQRVAYLFRQHLRISQQPSLGFMDREVLSEFRMAHSLLQMSLGPSVTLCRFNHTRRIECRAI